MPDFCIRSLDVLRWNLKFKKYLREEAEEELILLDIQGFDP